MIWVTRHIQEWGNPLQCYGAPHRGFFKLLTGCNVNCKQVVSGSDCDVASWKGTFYDSLTDGSTSEYKTRGCYVTGNPETVLGTGVTDIESCIRLGISAGYAVVGIGNHECKGYDHAYLSTMVAATDCSEIRCAESQQLCGSATSDIIFSKHDKLER